MSALACDPVSQARRYTHSYFRDRQRRSMKMLSMQRPRPSIEILTPARFMRSVQANDVNWLP